MTEGKRLLYPEICFVCMYRISYDFWMEWKTEGWKTCFFYFQYVLLLCQSGPIKDRGKARTESDANFDENRSQACGCLFGGISHVNFTAGNFKRPGFQGPSVCSESEDSCPNVACHPSGIPENSTCFIARIHPISLREISGFLNAGLM